MPRPTQSSSFATCVSKEDREIKTGPRWRHFEAGENMIYDLALRLAGVRLCFFKGAVKCNQVETERRIWLMNETPLILINSSQCYGFLFSNHNLEKEHLNIIRESHQKKTRIIKLYVLSSPYRRRAAVSVASDRSPALSPGLNISTALGKSAEVAGAWGEFHYLAIKAALKSERDGGAIDNEAKECMDQL